METLNPKQEIIKEPPSKVNKATLSHKGSPTHSFGHLRQQNHLQAQMNEFKAHLWLKEPAQSHKDRF